MDKFTKTLVAITVIGIMSAFLAIVGTGIYLAVTEPYCPQEDSCSANYHDGAWHIEEKAPGTY